MSDVDVTRNGDLGRRLRQLRTTRGLSLAEVAEATGISPSFVGLSLFMHAP